MKSPAPTFRIRCTSSTLTAAALRIKRESLLPIELQAARQAARLEGLALAALLLIAGLVLHSCQPSPALSQLKTAASLAQQ
jgi:hypothetical protein